jgi:hypothetical protein
VDVLSSFVIAWRWSMLGLLYKYNVTEEIVAI